MTAFISTGELKVYPAGKFGEALMWLFKAKLAFSRIHCKDSKGTDIQCSVVK